MRKLSKVKQCQLNDEMRHVAALYFDLNVVQRSVFGTLVVEGHTVKIASWEEDHHNGDIDHYKERDPKPGELKGWIPELERLFKVNAWERAKRKMEDQALADFYDRNLIPHSE